MKFNVFIDNHGKSDGILEFIAILTDAITKRGYEVYVSKELDPNAVNLIIDEFTDYISNRIIIAFKRQYPDTRLIYVLTEFIEDRLFVRSFNFFDGIIDASVIAVMNVYFRMRRRDFNSPTIWHWITALVYLPLLLLYILNLFVKQLIKRNRLSFTAGTHRTAYMLMRYLGLEKMITVADGVILSHNAIAANLSAIIGTVPVFGTIHPEVDFGEIKKSLFVDKQLYIEITGSITPFRSKIIRKINAYILQLGIKNRFELCKAISFSDSDNKDTGRAAYSLHPPQSRNWKYSSPTRIFRALQHDHNMPVLTTVFGQHPIEKLCLEFQGDNTLLEMYQYFKAPDSLINYLEPLVNDYSKVANKENDDILQALLAISQHSETQESVN